MTADESIAAALKTATDTRCVRIGRGALAEVSDVYRQQFGQQPAVVVADPNTFKAAGQRVLEALRGARIKTLEPIILAENEPHANDEHLRTVQAGLADRAGIPVAVGSGTVNDLTKLSAHRCGRKYMVVATAASMDGYAAYGASINSEGSKQTFDCPAPRAIVADLDVIAAAPPELNAAGYADLIAKTAAGADWILADALGIEPIHAQAWSLVQDNLRAWVSRPEAIRRGEPEAIRGLLEGLIFSGLAMQAAKSSRPASGADHQFSHLWDMQDHHHKGRIPYHGFKVGIGTIASTLLYGELFRERVDSLDVMGIAAKWPEWQQLASQIESTHLRTDLKTLALRECQAKYMDRDRLRDLLSKLKAAWPALRPRLQQQLLPSGELRAMLAAAGAPSEPEQIGIDRPRLQRSYFEAQQIRRRFTVLDLAAMTGLLTPCVDHLFAPGGAWFGGPL